MIYIIYIILCSVSEYRKLLKSLNFVYSHKKWNLIFKRMDLNYDGHVC